MVDFLRACEVHISRQFTCLLDYRDLKETGFREIRRVGGRIRVRRHQWGFGSFECYRKRSPGV